MPATKVEIRSGAYYDSVVLMQLQHTLAGLPAVLDVGVVMGTDVNKQILARSDLLTSVSQHAAADDLIIVVRAETDTAAQDALAQVDELLTARRASSELEYRPKSLEGATQMLPDAQWVLISVPGRYAAGLARQALRLEKSVFLYSDNISREDETDLKSLAAEKGLLVMGPDCGTAIVNGVGLGFANKVRRGPIGIVAASGTGLQQVSSRIHQLGSGISHGLGTGGRDLSEAVGGTTVRQCLALLGRDDTTEVIVLISKPPAPAVADSILTIAQSIDKPVVIDFIGYTPAARQVDNLHFAATLDQTAELAVQLAEARSAASSSDLPRSEGARMDTDGFTLDQRYLRGLYSGGTLAYEALLILKDYLPDIYSNAPLDSQHRLEDSLVSHGHTIVDLGEDEFTVGRLHPMMDNSLRIRRLRQEALDPLVAVILLDVVLGHGAHPNPAGELGPAIAVASASAAESGRRLHVVAVVVGTSEDPQDLDAQIGRLQAAGAHVHTSHEAAVRSVGDLLRKLGPPHHIDSLKPVALAVLQRPLAAINAGLESFADSLRGQDAPVVQLDWRPPAGGDERLAAILARLKQ